MVNAAWYFVEIGCMLVIDSRQWNQQGYRQWDLFP